MTRDQSDYDFLVSEYGKTQNLIRELEEENKRLKSTLVYCERMFDKIATELEKVQK